MINGKRLIQSATDIFVGWGSLHGRDYYVRQFRDMKIIPTTELIAPRLVEFATACGETLARAHARTGDPVAIDGYIGKGPRFTEAIASFARRTPTRTSGTTTSWPGRSGGVPRRCPRWCDRPHTGGSSAADRRRGPAGPVTGHRRFAWNAPG